jgi:hypothetical protein
MTSRHRGVRRALFTLFAAVSLAFATQAPAQTASGLIKKASAGLPVRSFEQVVIGQVIPLGSSGHLEISYYASCLLETIDGGTVTIGSFSSKVEGGRIATTKDQKSCHPQQVATTTSTAESGAVVERVVPAFNPRDWVETTVSVARPVFSPAGSLAAPVRLRLTMLDDPQPKLIWEGAVKSVPATYPAGAPPLQTGLPYRAELVGADGKTYAATFSIDPGYLTESGSGATTVEVTP